MRRASAAGVGAVAAAVAPARADDQRRRMGSTWFPAYVALGSNLADPAAQVEEAFRRLAGSPALRLEIRSRLYLSTPMGPQDQPDYVNAAAGILTTLQPLELLQSLLSIERAMGRDRRERWGPRVIDLDLIWMPGPPISEPGLTLPHPGVSQRNFVLYPLADIAPTLQIPGMGTVSELMEHAGSSGLSVLERTRVNT